MLAFSRDQRLEATSKTKNKNLIELAVTDAYSWISWVEVFPIMA